MIQTKHRIVLLTKTTTFCVCTLLTLQLNGGNVLLDFVNKLPNVSLSVPDFNAITTSFTGAVNTAFNSMKTNVPTFQTNLQTAVSQIPLSQAIGTDALKSKIAVVVNQADFLRKQTVGMGDVLNKNINAFTALSLLSGTTPTTSLIPERNQWLNDVKNGTASSIAAIIQGLPLDKLQAMIDKVAADNPGKAVLEEIKKKKEELAKVGADITSKTEELKKISSLLEKISGLSIESIKLGMTIAAGEGNTYTSEVVCNVGGTKYTVTAPAANGVVDSKLVAEELIKKIGI